jgi:hypothetical protein
MHAISVTFVAKILEGGARRASAQDDAEGLRWFHKEEHYKLLWDSSSEIAFDHAKILSSLLDWLSRWKHHSTYWSCKVLQRTFEAYLLVAKAKQ